MKKKLLIWTVAILTGLSMGRGQAVQLRDGKVHFNNPPRLVDASTSQNSISATGVVYAFAIAIPQDAGEALARVQIRQAPSPDQVQFDLDSSPSAIAIDNQNNISINFNPPIPPGQDVQIRLRAIRNPGIGGVYLFGVTAFPQGATPQGQFLGYGRLHIYESKD